MSRSASSSGSCRSRSDPVAERRALDRRRGEPDDPLQQAAVADRDDARVVQRRHPLEGRQHPVHRRERREPRREHVQLDRARVPPVARREAEQHRALRRAVGHLEPLGEGAADLLQLTRGGGPGLVRAGRGTAPERRGPGVGRRQCLTRAETDQPGLDGGIGLGLEVLPDERRVHARELQRTDAVARGDEGFDEADGGGGAHRLRRREPPPPAGRGRVILSRRRRRRELLERGGELARVAHPLGILPRLELGRLVETEAVEKGAAVEPDGPLVRALLDRVEKFGDVAGHALGVELEGGAPEKDVVPAEGTADGVERLVQRVARGFGLAVGPQQRQEPVPADAAAAGRRDDGQQCQPAALGRRTGMQLAVLVQDQPAQRAQSQHDGGNLPGRAGRATGSLGTAPAVPYRASSPAPRARRRAPARCRRPAPPPRPG